MRKISESYENPLDNINIDCVDKLCPLFHKLGMTPNHITTISLLFGLLSLYHLYNKQVLPFSIYFYISYLFDCMDGHFARKYNMVTKLGDIYDHIKDWSIIVGIVLVIYYKYGIKFNKYLIIYLILIILLFLSMVSHLGCQERIYNKPESHTLEITKQFCVGDPHKTIKITRWFGCGTWLVLSLIITNIYLNYTINKK
jgi:phosphatidylglycerophosphate synthase